MTNKFTRKNSARNEFVSGLKDGLPLQIGVIPFGIVFGIVGLEVGLSPLQTFLMSSRYLEAPAKLYLHNYMQQRHHSRW